jgi:prolyl-tRNA synthetase
VLLDDRVGPSPGVKFKDAELVGVPRIAIVGRGLVKGVIEVRSRRLGTSVEVPVADAAAALATLDVG